MGSDLVRTSSEDDNKIILTGNFQPRSALCFHSGTENVGSLDWSTGVFKFEGDAEESAKIFFNWLNDLGVL